MAKLMAVLAAIVMTIVVSSSVMAKGYERIDSGDILEELNTARSIGFEVKAVHTKGLTDRQVSRTVSYLDIDLDNLLRPVEKKMQRSRNDRLSIYLTKAGKSCHVIRSYGSFENDLVKASDSTAHHCNEPRVYPEKVATPEFIAVDKISCYRSAGFLEVHHSGRQYRNTGQVNCNVYHETVAVVNP